MQSYQNSRSSPEDNLGVLLVCFLSATCIILQTTLYPLIVSFAGLSFFFETGSLILPDDHEKCLELRSELINIFVIITTLVFTFHTGHAFLISFKWEMDI